MTETLAETRSIVVEEVLLHAPALLWRALTELDLISRWMRVPTGFAPVPGQSFTFIAKPAGAWDGLIRCRVLEAQPEQRLVYSWTGGDDGNDGYGAPMDTTVTFTLTKVQGGTKLRFDHAGFDVPRNAVALENMGKGRPTVMARLMRSSPSLADLQRAPCARPKVRPQTGACSRRDRAADGTVQQTGPCSSADRSGFAPQRGFDRGTGAGGGVFNRQDRGVQKKRARRRPQRRF